MDSDAQSPFVIAVHGGAGDHTEEDERAVRRALRSACKRALDSASALDAAQAAIGVLEEDAVLNAGYGSNLTEDGRVECDAALMEGSGAFGSVGAVGGVKNPITLARHVLDAGRVRGALGRVPPLTLVADGAARLAAPEQRVDAESLVAPRARALWAAWKARLDEQTDLNPVSTPTTTSAISTPTRLPMPMQDTVGAAACVRGGMAAGVSSGGILLKLPGRVGEAAVYGAGCWAADGVACSVSGTGEDIVRAALARTIAETIVSRGPDETHDALHDVLVHSFCEPCFARGEPEPSAGAIVLVQEDSARGVRLWCAFTTASMAVGYASSAHPKPKAVILRRPASEGPNANSDSDGTSRARVYIAALPLDSS